MNATISAQLVVDHPDEACAIFDHLDSSPELVRQMDAEALAIGFEMLSDAECAPEVTDDGRLKVWMSQVPPSTPMPNFESDSEWLAYWRANTPPLTREQKRRVIELLDHRIAHENTGR